MLIIECLSLIHISVDIVNKNDTAEILPVMSFKTPATKSIAKTNTTTTTSVYLAISILFAGIIIDFQESGISVDIASLERDTQRK